MNDINKINSPHYAEKVLEVLESNGFESYFVGGCVRDSLLGNAVADWDVCTAALPEQTMKCFSSFKIIDKGIKHGTVGVITDKKIVEITTFRTDGDYLDNRRPSSVFFSTDLREDLKRRDFTVNAMVFSPKRGFFDYFGGTDDLEKGIIRCVGNPEERFNEDALRIMRAVRFASKLGFAIEKGTEQAAFDCNKLLENISAERITTEFNGIILSANASKSVEKYRSIFEVFLPEITQFFYYKALENSKAELPQRLALLLKNAGIEVAEAALKRMRYSKAISAETCFLLDNANTLLEASEPLLRRLCAKFGDRRLQSLIDFLIASESDSSERLLQLTAAKEIAEKIISDDLCRSLSDLAVDGRELAVAGIPGGRATGEILEQLLEAVISGEITNEKKQLLKKAAALKNFN